MEDLPVNYNLLHPNDRRVVRERYVEIQNGLCSFCDMPLDGEPAKEIAEKEIDDHLFPKGFFKFPVHLHHDHVTGMTIGAVHCYCNAVLWQYHGE